MSSVIKGQTIIAESLGKRLPEIADNRYVHDAERRQMETMRSYENELSQIDDKLLRLYESLAEGLINEDEYMYARSEYVRMISEPLKLPLILVILSSCEL